jgi:hypothetical protein
VGHREREVEEERLVSVGLEPGARVRGDEVGGILFSGELRIGSLVERVLAGRELSAAEMKCISL